MALLTLSSGGEGSGCCSVAVVSVMIMVVEDVAVAGVAAVVEMLHPIVISGLVGVDAAPLVVAG